MKETNIAFWSSIIIANMGFMTRNEIYGMVWLIFAIILFLLGGKRLKLNLI